MANVIPFPGAMTALGFTFPAVTLSDGVNEAGRRGIERERISALMDRDRPFAVYFLCHLGSDDAFDRRVGEFGLRRLLGEMGDAA